MTVSIQSISYLQLAGPVMTILLTKKQKTPQETFVLETSKTNPRYHSTCENHFSPPLRSPATSMHWRSIHGKRLLGDEPLGLPAQKGWEFPRLLIGLPPSPTLWKIRCRFRLHRCLWELIIEFVHTLPLSGIRVNSAKMPKSKAESQSFSALCTNVFYARTFHPCRPTVVCLSWGLFWSWNSKNGFLVFVLKTKALDKRTWRC